MNVPVRPVARPLLPPVAWIRVTMDRAHPWMSPSKVTRPPETSA